MTFQTVYTKAAPWALPVLAVLFLFSLKDCTKYSGQVQDYARNLDSVAKTAKTFQNQLGQQVAENVQLKVQSSDDLKKMTDTIFNLKKADQKKTAQVTEYARILQEIKVKDKLATWDTTAKRDTAGSVFKPFSDSIAVPKGFHYDDSAFSIRGTVLISGVHIDSVSLANTVNFRTLTQKTGFLGLGRKSVVQVINTNPNVKTAGVTSIVVPPTLNWWQRVGKPVAFAVAAAVATSFLIKH